MRVVTAPALPYPPAAPLLGMAADVLFADPRRLHPVAMFGAVAAWAEQRLWRDARWAGAVYTAGCVGGCVLLGGVLQRFTARHPAGRLLAAAVSTWAVVGATTLGREALQMRRLLSVGDLDAARSRLSHLCSRDASGLETRGVTRATVESVAENTSDAVVAPLFWGMIAGIPGLLGYRAANTLDAMVGYHSARHEHFGWAAARLDDALNWLPARLTALLAVLCAPLVGGSPKQALATWRRDAKAHPSPNAGRCEAAFAGALQVTLGGVNVYGGHAEERSLIGLGRAPEPGDIARAVRLSRAVGLAAAVLATIVNAARR